ncbi:MAG: oligosaccharide flippase family protein [Anaerolineae bacterium]|nr:oligosaccharide flippase family protein [Anaerolineae bacterium]MDW8100873.1 oligosaccharide flippase family protein [Anaerolineae bacterium]
MIRRARRDALSALLLLIIPFLWFASVLTGQRTLLPADNLYAWEPWRSFATQMGVDIPHNELLSDLILENYPWKRFILESLQARQIPLWNPYLFSGMPFLADAQHSALYPFSLLFWILPLEMAYGWFTALQIGLAGVSLYALARALRLSRPAALIGGVAYMLSGFFMVSVVFTMMIAAAAWLPALLACIEVVIRKQEEKGDVPYSPVPYVALGSLILGIQVLAGHIEITYYVLVVSGFYAAWRLVGLRRRLGRWRPAVRLGLWLLTMAVVGLALAGVQLLPLVELAQRNFRQGSVGYRDVIGWAWPARQVLTFLLPDVFGNPSHHAYWDIWARRWVPVTVNALGEPIRTIFWGIKNYVEGGNYLGLLTLGLVGVAFARAALVWSQRTARWWDQTAFFAALGLISLANAFGTPVFALFYYGLPWYQQVHSPFRWVFPLTLAAAVLASLGADALIRSGRSPGGSLSEIALDERTMQDLGRTRRIARGIALAMIMAGLGTLALVGISLVAPGPFVAVSQRVVDSSDLARMAFADGRMFWSYQAVNLLKFGAIAVLSGLVLWLAARRLAASAQRPLWRDWPALAVAVLAFDLWLAFGSFHPAADPRLLHFIPPSIAWLQARLDEDEGPWRFTTLNVPGEKTLNANAGWLYGLQDVRGYDSIIPKQYAEYMDRIQPQAGELLYNRIAPIYTEGRGQPGYQALDSPWLHLLGVRYVVTTQHIPNPTYELVYDGEVRIYRNRSAMPRAFVMRCASAQTEMAIDWATVDPKTELVLDDPSSFVPRPSPSFTHLASCALNPASITRYTGNEVEVQAVGEAGAYLVLADAYFPGWKAYARPEGIALAEEREVPIYRAYGNFRAVPLEAGRQIVRFKYSPMSFKLGVYSSFLAWVTVFLAMGWWAWGRFYRDVPGEASEVWRVAKNSLIPMALSLLNKGIDFAFAMLRLRILNPVGEGSYTFAINFYAIFEILVRFGLGTLLTREVARDRTQAGRFLSNAIALRVGLWLAALPLMVLVGGAYRIWGGLTLEEAWAIALFAVALLFAGLADAISAVFNAYEQMEYPAGIASAIAVGKVTLGALVLLPPLSWGFVGLAGVSVIMNLAQTLWLYRLLCRKLFTPQAALDRPLQRKMLHESVPLMINHLLATIFFRVDVWILKPFSGAEAVGLYGAAYKYIDGLNVIPAYFTMAIFPLMSRLARNSREAMARAYVLALRLLLMISLPIAVLTTFIARPLILILGGEEFLPGSALALQILIWSIPMGFINSVTQYVLIAVDQQRFLTRAFVIGVVFNMVANLIFVPRYSYLAAAVITILSEFALLVPFYYAVRRHVTRVPWAEVVWRPAVAAMAMGLSLWLGSRWTLLGAAMLSVAIYSGVLVILGTFRQPDMATVLRQLPSGWRPSPYANGAAEKAAP